MRLRLFLKHLETSMMREDDHFTVCEITKLTDLRRHQHNKTNLSRDTGNTSFKFRIYWRYLHYPRADCIDTNFRSIPQNIPEDVKTIILSGNRLNVFNIKDLRKFKSLKSLYLTGVIISIELSL